MRAINKIIVHCSATSEGKDFSAHDIDIWHKQRGFTGIGYHYVVRLDGTVEKGRADSAVGAHCQGHNKNSIGVCYIGGLLSDGKTPADTRTDAQKKSLLELLSRLRQTYPAATILGHCDLSNKACPCFDAKKEYELL